MFVMRYIPCNEVTFWTHNVKIDVPEPININLYLLEIILPENVFINRPPDKSA